MTAPMLGLGSLFSQAQQGFMQQLSQQNPFQNQFGGVAGGFMALNSPLALQPCDQWGQPFKPPEPLSPVEALEKALAATSYEHWIHLGGGATFSEWRHS